MTPMSMVLFAAIPLFMLVTYSQAADCSKRPSLIAIKADNTTDFIDSMQTAYDSWNSSVRLGFNSYFNSMKSIIYSNATYKYPADKINALIGVCQSYNKNNPNAQLVLWRVPINGWCGNVTDFINCGNATNVTASATTTAASVDLCGATTLATSTSILTTTRASTTTILPSTSAPTTTAPSTSAPTTLAPSTSAPTTTSPSTSAPTTTARSTSAPTTIAPSTSAPTTTSPSTSAPTTTSPSTSAPTTTARSTSAPTTTAPSTSAPTTTSPSTSAPTTTAPSTSAPTTTARSTSAPTTTSPSTSAPTTLAPSTTILTSTNVPSTASSTNLPTTSVVSTSLVTSTPPPTTAATTPTTPLLSTAVPTASVAPSSSAPVTIPSTPTSSSTAPTTLVPSTTLVVLTSAVQTSTTINLSTLLTSSPSPTPLNACQPQPATTASLIFNTADNQIAKNTDLSSTCSCTNSLTKAFYDSVNDPDPSGSSVPAVTLSCSNINSFCMCTESGECFTQKGDSLDSVAIYPFCQAADCHMYAFVIDAFDGSSGLQGDGFTSFISTDQFTDETMSALKSFPDPVYLKPVAAGCDGCAALKQPNCLGPIIQP